MDAEEEARVLTPIFYDTVDLVMRRANAPCGGVETTMHAGVPITARPGDSKEDVVKRFLKKWREAHGS